VFYSFCSQSHCIDGSKPTTLVQGTDGTFYGTTVEGGLDNSGTVFKITPDGILTRLYSFCRKAMCPDGEDPVALIQATDGDFYGTTETGAANHGGTVFKINSNGTLTTIYTFCSRKDCIDGSNPRTGLIQGADGNLYGTTGGGGANHWGTVFKITMRPPSKLSERVSSPRGNGQLVTHKH